MGFAARLANRRPAPRRGQTLSIVREIIVQWLLPIIPATVAEITSRISATTLLASVEPCSAPADVPPRDLFGHHAACQRGAMFKARRRPAHCVHRLEHRSTLASSVVAKRGPIFGGISGLEHRSTLASSVVARRPIFRGISGLEHRSRHAAIFGHHAACQRGAMFSTSRRPAPRPLRPPRCLPAWSHVQHQPTSRRATSSATTLLASVEPCSKPDVGALTASSISNTAPRCLPAWWRRGGDPPPQRRGRLHLASQRVPWLAAGFR